MLSEKFVLRMLHLHHLHLKAISAANSSNTFGDGRVPNRLEAFAGPYPMSSPAASPSGSPSVWAPG